VELIAAGKNMTMRVDGGAARTIINDGEHQFMELEEPLYLGGLPASVRESAKKKYHVRNTDSFNGKQNLMSADVVSRQHSFIRPPVGLSIHKICWDTFSDNRQQNSYVY